MLRDSAVLRGTGKIPIKEVFYNVLLPNNILVIQSYVILKL